MVVEREREGERREWRPGFGMEGGKNKNKVIIIINCKTGSRDNKLTQSSNFLFFFKKKQRMKLQIEETIDLLSSSAPRD